LVLGNRHIRWILVIPTFVPLILFLLTQTAYIHLLWTRWKLALVFLGLPVAAVLVATVPFHVSLPKPRPPMPVPQPRSVAPATPAPTQTPPTVSDPCPQAASQGFFYGMLKRWKGDNPFPDLCESCKQKIGCFMGGETKRRSRKKALFLILAMTFAMVVAWYVVTHYGFVSI